MTLLLLTAHGASCWHPELMPLCYQTGQTVQPCKQQLLPYSEAEWGQTRRPAAAGLCRAALTALSASTAQGRSWHPPLSLILPLRKVLLQSLPEVQLSAALTNKERAASGSHGEPKCRAVQDGLVGSAGGGGGKGKGSVAVLQQQCRDMLDSTHRRHEFSPDKRGRCQCSR